LDRKKIDNDVISFISQFPFAETGNPTFHFYGKGSVHGITYTSCYYERAQRTKSCYFLYMLNDKLGAGLLKYFFTVNDDKKYFVCQKIRLLEPRFGYADSDIDIKVEHIKSFELKDELMVGFASTLLTPLIVVGENVCCIPPNTIEVNL
jgi:hypothetical protein